MMTKTTTTCTPADFYYSDYWGITDAPSTSPHSAGRIEQETGFLTALCNAAGGDGTASKVERDHIFGMASVKGYTPEAIAQINALADAAESKTIEEMAADAKKAMSIGTLRFAVGSIVFESIKAASKVRIFFRCTCTFWYTIAVKFIVSLYIFSCHNHCACAVLCFVPNHKGRS